MLHEMTRVAINEEFQNAYGLPRVTLAYGLNTKPARADGYLPQYIGPPRFAGGNSSVSAPRYSADNAHDRTSQGRRAMRTLQELTVKNFKSIRDQTLELRPLNVFIGGNGAGKSNLIETFRFLREIVNQNLADYTLTKGGANALLHFGRKRSATMAFRLEFGAGTTSNAYHVELKPTDDDTFIIASETAFFHDKVSHPEKAYDLPVGFSSRESQLKEDGRKISQHVLADLDSYRVYHFHDTSDTANVKASADLEDNRFLRPQAENLAPFLYWMKAKEPDHYRLIVDTLRQIAPFFDDFQLEPSRLNESRIRLEWRERGSDTHFNAYALSDGTLRFICLVTLLTQPNLPRTILLDEPELGLHPAAIALLAELLTSASERAQILVATQSVTLVNQLEPHHVWAADREDNASVFRQLASEDMSQWLDTYALGELWEKNLLGARP